MSFLGIIHVLLQIVQVGLAIGLVIIVTSQTNKDQGMGGAFGGGDAGGGGSRYTGGYEEKLDNLAKNLAFSFLLVSFFVALIAHNLQ